MNRRGRRRIRRIALLGMAALLGRGMAAAQTGPADLGPITDAPAEWKLIERKPGAAQIRTADGAPALLVEQFPVSLVSTRAWGPDSELTVRFRLTPGDKPVSLSLETALADANDRDRGLYLAVGTRGERIVSWTGAVPDPPPGARPTKGGECRLGVVAERSLSWSEAFRKQIEADRASGESVAEHVFTLRAVLARDGVEFFLDEVPLHRLTKTGLKNDGIVRVVAQRGVSIVRLTARKLAAEKHSGLHHPIPLDPLLNADRIDGRRLDASSLGGGDRRLSRGEVPFLLPPPDRRGRDHVDVGASWLRQGSLEGLFSGDRDPFGGRWAGALERDPARLQLRVPPGRYSALHLLAAADGDRDSVPKVTVQFFRAGSGFPVSFVSPAVPGLAAQGPGSIPVKAVGEGRGGALHHVVIPLDPGALAEFADQDFLDLELTKEVRLYRAYPDPAFYSMHGAGLPSSVHIFAATLERPAIDVKLEADAYGHVWTAPARPTYTVRVRNRAGAGRPVGVALETRSFREGRATSQEVTLSLGEEGREAAAAFPLQPPCYGHHDLTLTVTDGGRRWREIRSLAYLHEDTRERGGWEFGRGPMFGYWHWGGSHATPDSEKTLRIMGAAGAETVHCSLYDPGGRRITAAARKAAEGYRIRSYAFAGASHYSTLAFAEGLQKEGLEAARERFLRTLREHKAPDGDPINDPRFVSFFAEPHVGPYTSALMPDYYGEPEAVFSPSEEERFQRFLGGFVEGARIIRENFPKAKCLLPWGDPLFAVPFLRRSADARGLVDGVAVDIPCFERLPEQQMHQVSIHRLYSTRTEFRRAGIENPILAMHEGPCLPTSPGSLDFREAADLALRNSLILLAYGVDFQAGGFGGFDTAGAWGEQHYGSGILRRVPLEMPKPAYAAFATHTRMLNRCNFDGWTPTGSLSVYALRFRHCRSEKVVHVLWTIRGARPVALSVPDDAAVRLTDVMDNSRALIPKDGRVSFVVDSSPCYLTGLPHDVRIALGDPDHSDARPGPLHRKLANFGDGTWALSSERDRAYEQSHFPYIVRFPGVMTVAPAAAPAEQGGRALAVRLEKQDKERIFMPHYAALVPAGPIEIPGKAGRMGVWIRAASDWGRVVYFLKDARGERWIGVGKAGAWNNDDTHSWTSFCFDGWRYLRFELPAHSPYDGFREAGSTWWGAYGDGDRIVDLPLAIEKVVVERRTHAMYVNDPQPVRPEDVLLGDLFAEYERVEDQGPEAVRLASLRMPEPAHVPPLDNPIERMAAAGAGEPTRITRITLPEQDADGTKCHVHFDKRDGAVAYDIWAGRYADGRGAVRVAKGLKESGMRVRGFQPDTDFYLFVVYADGGGGTSKPSDPFKIRLKDLFGMK